MEILCNRMSCKNASNGFHLFGLSPSDNQFMYFESSFFSGVVTTICFSQSSFSNISKQVVMSFCMAGAALCDIPTCLIMCRKSFCVAGAILLRQSHKMSCSFRGRRGILEISVVILRGRRRASDVSHCVPYAPHSTLHTPHFTLHTPYFTLHTPHSILHAPHISTLYTLHCTLHTLQSTLYSLHFTLHTAHSTLYTPHFTLYTWHSTLYSPHSAIYTPHSTLFTLHSTRYTPRSTLHSPHITLYTPHSTLHTLHTLHSTLHTLHFRLHALHLNKSETLIWPGLLFFSNFSKSKRAWQYRLIFQLFLLAYAWATSLWWSLIDFGSVQLKLSKKWNPFTKLRWLPKPVLRTGIQQRFKF